MKDVNGKILFVGAKVYDLSVEKLIENYGPPNVIMEINNNNVLLDNGKLIDWKGPGYFVALAIEQTKEVK